MRFEFDYSGESWSKDGPGYFSRVPTIEIYRYSDKSLVTTLNAKTAGQWTTGGTGIKEFELKTDDFTDFDETAMYFKFIAPSVGMTISL